MKGQRIAFSPLPVLEFTDLSSVEELHYQKSHVSCEHNTNNSCLFVFEQILFPYSTPSSEQEDYDVSTDSKLIKQGPVNKQRGLFRTKHSRLDHLCLQEDNACGNVR